MANFLKTFITFLGCLANTLFMLFEVNLLWIVLFNFVYVHIFCLVFEKVRGWD